MASDIVSSLFGPTTYDIQQQQTDAMRARALDFAKLDPRQRAAMSIFEGGGMLGNVINDYAGWKDPRILATQRAEEAAKGLDFSDPQAILERAQQIEDPRLRLRMITIAQQREADMRKAEADRVQMELNRAHAKYYEGGGAASKTGSLSMDNRTLLKRMDAENAARQTATRVGADRGLGGADLQAFVENSVKAAREMFDASYATQTGQAAATPTAAPAASPVAAASTAPAILTGAETIPNGVPGVPGFMGDPRALMKQIIQDPTMPAADKQAALAQLKAQMESAGVSMTTPAAPPAVPTRAGTVLPTRAAAEAEIAGSKKAAEASVETIGKEYDAVQQAPINLQKIAALEAQLKRGDVTTGAVADFRLAVNKAVAALGGKDAAKKATDTEIANVMMGADVFPLIQSLGVGARGMDTPAEREFLRSVLTGSIQLEKGTLLDMASRRRKAEEDRIARWNSRIGSGELDTYFKNNPYVSKNKVSATGKKVVKWNEIGGKP